MKSVVVTFNPWKNMYARKSFFNPNYGRMAYLELLNSLNNRGACIDFFGEKDFDFLAHELESGNALQQYAKERFKNAGLILHHPHEHNASLVQCLIDKRDSVKAGLHILAWSKNNTTLPEHVLDTILFKSFGDISHGVYTPIEFSHENIKRKDMQPAILEELDVPAPRTVVHASNFNHDFYPAFVKHAMSSNGRNVYHVENEEDFMRTLKTIRCGKKRVYDHVVQEDLSWDREGSYSIRAMCVAGRVIGVVANISSGDYVTNKGKNVFQCYAPGFPYDYTPAVCYMDDSFTFSNIPEGLGLALKEADFQAGGIAEYCAQKGSQISSVEMISGQVIDVNGDPGSREFNVQFGMRYLGQKSMNVAAEVQADVLVQKLKE